MIRTVARVALTPRTGRGKRSTQRQGAMRPSCLVCGAYMAPARLPGLLSCAQCKFLTADMQLDDAALASLYGRDYFHGEEYGDYVSEEGELRANFRSRLQTLYRFVSPA